MAKKTTTTVTEKTAPRAKSAAASKAAPAPRHSKATEPTKAAASHRAPQPAVAAHSITHDDIATLAFSYWQRRGYQGGSQQDDWNRAERELRSLLA